MSEWNEDDDTSHSEEPSSGLSVRRAVLGGVAGLALLAGPVALSTAVVPDSEAGIEAAGPDSLFSVLNARSTAASRLSEEQINTALAAEDATVERKPSAATTSTTTSTTTTTAPPTTTTTVPPTTTTAPPTTPPPTTEPSSGVLGDPYYEPTWDHLAQCESGGDWSINTGNGYYGGIQFSLSSWQAVGGSGYPNENSREEQIYRGQLLWEQQGWGAWPACTASFGWR